MKFVAENDHLATAEEGQAIKVATKPEQVKKGVSFITDTGEKKADLSDPGETAEDDKDLSWLIKMKDGKDKDEENSRRLRNLEEIPDEEKTEEEMEAGKFHFSILITS